MGADEQTPSGDDEQGDPRDLAVASGSGCADEDVQRGGQNERAERATWLYLRGRRVAEVAAELAVSETTVRRWTRQALLNLAEEEREAQVTRLERAIESQRAVAAAAWEAYERERRLDEALLRGELDSVRRRAIRGRRQRTDPRDDADDTDCPPLAMEEYERPKRSAQGPRYLSVALAAQREVARLQGLYARLEQPDRAVRITISRRPDGSENHAPVEDAPRDERREAGDA